MTNGPWFRWLRRGFLVLGILLFSTWAASEFQAHAFQTTASADFDPSPPIATPIAEISAVNPDTTVHNEIAAVRADRTRPLGRLEIPRLRITAIVAEGVDAKTLGRAVGHVPASALPGDPGNCAIAGHRDTFLRGLGNVRVNDLVRIVTRENTHVYAVEWTEVVEPRRIDVLDPTSERCVTLVTCYPFHSIGHAPMRFIVRARQVDAVAEFPADHDPN